MSVLSARPLASRASRSRPTCESTKLVQARYERVRVVHGSASCRYVRSRTGEDQRYAGAVIPERVFAGDQLLANVPAVIGPEHNERIVRPAAGVQGIQESAHLRVDEAGAGQVRAGEVGPLVSLLQVLQ